MRCIICGRKKVDDICPRESYHKVGRAHSPDDYLSGPFPEPELGQKIFVPSSVYLHRGGDDSHGGMATVKEIQIDEDCGIPTNRIMVKLEERPSSWYNWTILMQEQKINEEIYGEHVAHSDPDYREDFNKDDGWSAG